VSTSESGAQAGDGAVAAHAEHDALRHRLAAVEAQFEAAAGALTREHGQSFEAKLRDARKELEAQMRMELQVRCHLYFLFLTR